MQFEKRLLVLGGCGRCCAQLSSSHKDVDLKADRIGSWGMMKQKKGTEEERTRRPKKGVDVGRHNG